MLLLSFSSNFSNICIGISEIIAFIEFTFACIITTSLLPSLVIVTRSSYLYFSIIAVASSFDILVAIFLAASKHNVSTIGLIDFIIIVAVITAIIEIKNTFCIISNLALLLNLIRGLEYILVYPSSIFI